MAEKESYMPKDLYPVYKLGAILYLPHYKEADVFVGPGYGRNNFEHYTAFELMRAGATYTTMYLFERTRDAKKDIKKDIKKGK